MTRVLFVGDGKHDVGAPEWPAEGPFPACGVVPRLAERVAAIDRGGSQALTWARLARFSPDKKRGYLHKIRAAGLLAQRRLKLGGVVCVVDEDNDPSRRALVEEARSTSAMGCPVVCGVAVRSIEAWTLGAFSALAHVLGTTPAKLRAEYPAVAVETLYERSGKEEQRSKVLLDRLARELGRRNDSDDLRNEVAEQTDPHELCRSCPEGFAPFMAALREAFGVSAG